MESETEEWRDLLRNYEHQRSNLAWERAPTVQRVTHADMKNIETQYNPILQTYSNQKFEENVKQIEKDRLIDTLAKNKDRALRYEQTFNIINLEDKLRGLEHLPGYPEPKRNAISKNPHGESKVNYNIISGLEFADHHYLPPEQRPPREQIKTPTYKITAVEFKEYDIITNRYLQDHQDKSRQDLEFYKLDAAEKFWKTHDYDPIVGTFVDPDKEEEFQRQMAEEAKIHGLDEIEKEPNGIKYSEGALYEPINMRVVDSNRLYEIDLMEKERKERYETRYDIEREYRDRDVMEQERAKGRTLARQSHKKHTETLERGFNILTNQPFYGRNSEEKHLPFTAPKPTVWDRAMNEALPRPISHELLERESSRGSEMSRVSSSSRPIRSSGFKIAS